MVQNADGGWGEDLRDLRRSQPARRRAEHAFANGMGLFWGCWLRATRVPTRLQRVSAG